MHRAKQPIWTSDFILHSGGFLLLAHSFYFLLATMPQFATEMLGATTEQVGLVTGAFTITAVLFRPFAGYALDAWGRRSIYLWCLVVFTAAVAAHSMAGSLLALMAARALHGFSWAAVFPAGNTIATDLLPPQRLGEGIGYFALAFTLGMASGPLIAVSMAVAGRWQQMFTTAIILAALATISALFIRYPRIASRPSKLSITGFFEPSVLSVSTVQLMLGTVYGGIVTFITIFAVRQHLGTGGEFFLTYAVAMASFRPVVGPWLDRAGPRPAGIIGLIIYAAGFVLLGAAQNTWMLIAASALLGIGNGNLIPTLQTMVMQMTPPHRRGVANSTLMTAFDIGIGLGSVGLGWVAAVTSLRLMYLLSAALILPTLALFSLHTVKDYQRRLAVLQSAESDTAAAQ